MKVYKSYIREYNENEINMTFASMLQDESVFDKACYTTICICDKEVRYGNFVEKYLFMLVIRIFNSNLEMDIDIARNQGIQREVFYKTKCRNHNG